MVPPSKSKMPQWPSTPECRRALADYLCTVCKMNPYETLLPTLQNESPHSLSPVNGLIRLGRYQFPESLVADCAPHPRSVCDIDLAHLALHCALWFSIGNGTNWIRAQHLENPTRLTSILWSHVSYMHAWPHSIELAASCARPDIQAWCRAAYYDWLMLCRRPAAIEAALRHAMSEQWKLKMPSKPFEVVLNLVKQLQIATVCAASSDSPDIEINGSGGVFIAARDKALLAIMAFRGPDASVLSCIPAVSGAISAVPAAFTNLPQGEPWLDELS